LRKRRYEEGGKAFLKNSDSCVFMSVADL
jgi:hypothetical protein